MGDRAGETANVLLREGALRRDDPEHRLVYEELGKDPVLRDSVRERLAAVGYELVDDLGWLGVRVSATAERAWPLRNRMGLSAPHIRLIVYLWVQLVYRQVVSLRRGIESAAPGQLAMWEEEEEPHVSWRAVWNEFAERMAATHLKGALRRLKQLRFIRYDEKQDRIWADASLYVLVDRVRMEDFVVDLARRMGTPSPEEAVRAVVLGSALPEAEPEEGA